MYKGNTGKDNNEWIFRQTHLYSRLWVILMDCKAAQLAHLLYNCLFPSQARKRVLATLWSTGASTAHVEKSPYPSIGNTNVEEGPIEIENYFIYPHNQRLYPRDIKGRRSVFLPETL